MHFANSGLHPVHFEIFHICEIKVNGISKFFRIQMMIKSSNRLPFIQEDVIIVDKKQC